MQFSIYDNQSGSSSVFNKKKVFYKILKFIGILENEMDN